MIKYLGSKRRLAPVLGEMASAIGARSALDLFSGTTRVAQELKRRGVWVTVRFSASSASAVATVVGPRAIAGDVGIDIGCTSATSTGCCYRRRQWWTAAWWQVRPTWKICWWRR